MRARSDSTALAPGQAAAADAGLKAMIPIGRPFLDYVLSALADAGFEDVCLVIGAEQRAMRDYYTSEVVSTRLRVSFAEQERPIGTADAVLAAEAFAGGDAFIVLNSDNYYPIETFAALRALGEPGLAAFGRDALLADGQIPPERIASYALLDIDQHGYLRRIVEKPDPARVESFGLEARVSMNCWRFTSDIFEACRTVEPSPRGELELPLAVQRAIDVHGLRFRALAFDAPVLDLSSRADIAGVAARLAGVRVRL